MYNKPDRQDILRVSSNHMTVSQKNETFESSEFGLAPGVWPKGIEIRTLRTGRRILYTRGPALRDSEGELISVKYTSPEYGFTMTVIND